MVTLILPGYSAHNREWLEETTKNIDAEGEIRSIYWDHWIEPEKKFVAREKSRLLSDIAGRRMVDIIAKSIGTLVAAHVIQNGPEKIRKVVLCGIPLNGLTEDDKEIYKSALKLVPHENIICYQNEEDPTGGFDQVKKLLSDVNPEIKVISKPRQDHEYPFATEFRNFLKI